MSFASPVWLWGLLLLPLLPVLEARIRRRDEERTTRWVARALWARVLERPFVRWRPVRVALLTVAAAGVLLALARPQWGIVREKVEREGVDVVLVLDTSGSMAVDDVAPNRFFLARAALLSVLGRLDGDRVGLLAFEGEAYPLVPLTLDADAVGLFLETLEPGIVPAAGSSIGQGLAKALDMFVDKERRNKVIVLVSDGENLEGEVEGAVSRAKAAGVIVHAVGVGTERGAPVPEFDREGNRVGFKKDDSGAAVLSRLNPQTLEAIARGTGGRLFQITPSDSSLSGLTAAIAGLEQRSVAREYSYRKKERFQVPLAVALFAAAAALGLPLPLARAKTKAKAKPGLAALVLLALGLASIAAPGAWAASVPDEALLRPKRLTNSGRRNFAQGNHPEALKDFQKAAQLRPQDPTARFNLADGLYKNGKFDEAETTFRELGADAKSPLAAKARFNLGNALFQKKEFGGAVSAYRDALRLTPNDADTRRNLELALRELQQQKQKQQQKPQPQPQPSPSPSPQKGQGQTPQGPPSADQKEQQRFREETGMPRERAMQLLDALQQNEKQEQKRLLAEKQTRKKSGKDW